MATDVFPSLIRRAEEKLHERQDLMVDLDDLRYWHQCGEFQDSDNLVLSAKELLNLLIDDPALAPSPFVLKSYVMAFKAAQHKNHLAPPLPRERSADHSAECLDVRKCINNLCDKLRNVPQFDKSLKLPIAELKGCVLRTLCHQPGNRLSEVKELLKEFGDLYANPEDTSNEYRTPLLGLRGCMYVLDPSKAVEARIPSSPPPPPPPPPPPRVSKRQIETSDHVRTKSSAEPPSKRRRPYQSVQSPLHRYPSFSRDPLDDPYPRHCDHDGPCSQTKLECICKICYQECGCSASCEKKLPSCGCDGPCREDCECVRNNAECIDSRCSCSDCPNNFQEQKPVKLFDLESGGVASLRNLPPRNFVGVLDGIRRMEGRQDAPTGDLYPLAKNASLEVCKEDAELHRIESSSSQSDQNVEVLPYRRKIGHSLIIRTTKDIQAGERLLLPLDLRSMEYAREEHGGVARDGRSLESHETDLERSSIDDDLGNGEDSDEESEYEIPNDESTVEDESLSESDGEKDDQYQQDKRRTRSRAHEKTSLEALIHYALVRKESLTLSGLSKLCDVSTKRIKPWLMSASCCTIRDDTKPCQATHDKSKCTISIHKTTDKFKRDVKDFQDQPTTPFVVWTSELVEKFLRLRARGATMRELEAHLKNKYPTIPFTLWSLERKWADLKRTRTHSRRSLPQDVIKMIEGAQVPLSSHDLVKLACEAGDKTEKDIISWIEKYCDGIPCKIKFQSLESCFVSEDNTINHNQRDCSKGSNGLR